MVSGKALALAAAVLVLAGGCAAPTAAPSVAPSAAPKEVTVAAAASLQGALTEIGAGYEKTHPEVNLIFTFAGSGTLQKQIEEGAAVDLFISAGQKQMKALREKGLLQEQSQRDLLGNSLVLIVPAGKAAPKELKALADTAYRSIALGNPDSVPAGSYARDALTAAALYDLLSPRLVQGKDVKEVLTWVETGNADAGFVYRSDAKGSAQAIVAFEVEASLHKPILYPAAVVKQGPQAVEGAAFLEYLAADEAGVIFEAYGFDRIE